MSAPCWSDFTHSDSQLNRINYPGNCPPLLPQSLPESWFFQMDPVQIKSSAIQSLQFDEKANMLTVTFANGRSDVKPCDRATYEQFLKAPSAGKFWNERFRN